MPINFPDSPTTGDTHTVGDKTWTFDGTAWNLVLTGPSTEHGALLGLGDDDHIQYLLADGTRTATELNVSGDLTVDTGTLHVDATNNRVGIGTTSPSQALEIYVNSPEIRMTNDAVSVNSNFYYAGVTMRDSSENLAGAIGFISGEDQDMRITSYRAGASLHLVTGGANNNRITITDTGNVGIGTTSPTVPLDVVGDVNITTASGDGYLQVLYQAIDTALYANLTASGQMDAQEVSLFAQNPNTEIRLPISISGDPVAIYNLRGIGAVDFTLADSVTLDGSITDYGTSVALNSGNNRLVSQLVTDGSTWGEVRAWNTNTEGNIDLIITGENVLLYGTTVKINEVRVPVSDTIYEIVKLTQAAYDALTPDANTLYVIVG